MSSRSRVIAQLLLPVLLWTCGGAETESESAIEEAVPGAEPEAASGPAAEATIAGSTLTTTISVEEAGEDPETVGTWELVLADDGSYTVRQNETVAVEGTYGIEADRITLTDTGGPHMCEEYPEGTYRWSIAGDEVVMTVVDDECAPRVLVLTTHPQRME